MPDTHETEYKFLTTILRQLEDAHEEKEPTYHTIKTVITAIKDRKDYLFNKGFQHEIHP